MHVQLIIVVSKINLSLGSISTVFDSQKMNYEHDIDQEIDQRNYREEEAEIIKISAIEEITSLKNDLISWIKKWNLLRERKLRYKEQVKRILLKNRRLKKKNRIANVRAVKFKAKLNEARRSMPIRLFVESVLKT